MSGFNGKNSWSFTADGNGSTVIFNGGKATLSVFGGFGSGTVKWQRSMDNGTTWVDIVDATGTAAYGLNIECGQCQLRPVISGSTNPTVTAFATSF